MAISKEITANLAKIAADFKDKYRYRIAGQEDVLLKQIGPFITNEQKFQAFKSKRGATVRSIAAIAASVVDLNARAVDVAKERIKFLQAALKEVKNFETIHDSKSISSIVSTLTKELKTELTSYIDARTAQGGLDAGTDTQFLQDVRDLENAFDSMNARLKPRLAKDKQFFNLSHFQSGKRLDVIEETVDGLNILV